MTHTGEWEISAFISERVGRYDVQYTQTGLGGRAVYRVKGVICERDVYSILELTIAYVFLSIILTICMFLCIEQPVVF